MKRAKTAEYYDFASVGQERRDNMMADAVSYLEAHPGETIYTLTNGDAMVVARRDGPYEPTICVFDCIIRREVVR